MKTSFLAVVIAPVPFLFQLHLHTQVILILNLMVVQYLQNVVFSLLKKVRIVKFTPTQVPTT